MDDDQILRTSAVKSGSPIFSSTTLEKLKKEGYLFLGWIGPDGESADNSSTYLTDTILKASFVKDEDATGPDEIFFLPYDQYLSSNWRGGVGYLLSPGDVQDKRIYFETSDSEIAEIVPNEAEEFLYEIMPKKTGKVTVTGTTKSGLSKSYTLYVYDPAEHPQEELTEIIPLQDQLSLIVGEHGHPFNNTLTE